MKQMTLKRSDSPQIFYFFDELSLQIFMCKFLCIKLTDEVGVCSISVQPTLEAKRKLPPDAGNTCASAVTVCLCLCGRG